MENPNQLRIEIDKDLSNKLYRGLKAVIANSLGTATAVVKLDAEKGFKNLKEIISTDTRFDTVEKKLAFELIIGALEKALLKTREEAFKEYSITNENLVENEAYQSLINTQIDTFNQSFTIDSNFFKNPETLPLLPPLQESLCKLFESTGINSVNAHNLSLELKVYFSIELHRYWQKNSPALKPLLDYFESSPFSQNIETKLEWQEYYITLRRIANLTVFSDTVSLQNLYVSLRGYYIKKVKEDSSINIEEVNRENSTHTKYIIDVHKHLNQWIKKTDRHDAIRVLSGGPGRGKSTLCKIWAAELTTQNKDWQVLYVPFHLLNLKSNLEEMIQEYIKLPHIPLKSNPITNLKDSKNKLLLIFDGLDELSIQNLQTEVVVKQFIEQLRHLVNAYNYNNLHIKALLTGRDLVIQHCQKIFRSDSLFIHLLPYLLTKNKDKHQLNMPLDSINNEGILMQDQRELWWAQYASQKELPYQGMPPELKKLTHLNDITAEPLLNYLVAITWLNRPEIFNKNTNLNTIYKTLISDVYKREYALKPIHISAKEIGDEQSFLAILAMIGLAAWQGGNTRATTTLTVDNFINKLGTSKLKKQFKEYKDNKNTYTDRLFLAFYFKESTTSTLGAPTFEFTHKSFGEYLTAQGIVSLVTRCHRRYNKYLENTDDDATPYEEEQVIKELLLISNYTLDEDIVKFIENEFELIHTKASLDIKSLHDNICKWIHYSIKAMETVDSFITATDKHLTWNYKLKIYRNLEELLMVIRGICATILDSKIEIDLGQWLTRNQFHNKSSIGLKYLNHIFNLSSDLTGADLTGADLTGADLTGADLTGAYLTGADLTGADLTGADLTGADLNRADLNRADLTGAYLKGAYLNRADLTGAYLTGAYLTGAYLTGADLTGADLKGAYLNRADLRGAYLTGADLNRADLTGADLTGADLNRADLTGADLNRADLKGADLKGADLTGADLKGADLTGADLTGADLTGADLTGADLTGADLTGADLKGADLNRADLNRADLNRADLNRADLNRADLTGAYLNRAYLTGADLTGADLNRAYLTGADLTGADLNRADLTGADLTGADLNRADLTGALYNINTFLQVKTLHKAIGLTPNLEELLKKERPDIFDKKD